MKTGVEPNEILEVSSTVGKMNAIHITPGFTGSLYKDIGLKPWFASTKLTLDSGLATGHKFGEKISVSRSNDLLVVGCPSGSTYVTTSLDNKKTIFDGNATRLSADKFFTGSTHIFQKLSNNWLEADSLYTCLLYTSPSPRD